MDSPVIPQRLGRAAAVTLAGVLALTACGSDDNTGGTSTGSGNTTNADCPSGTLNAEGSSAQKNAIEDAIASYQEKCSGATVNYNPTGSGAGVKQFLAGQVDFAGSDSALKEDEGEVEAAAERCEGNPAWDLPMVAGPIAVSYNLDGVTGVVLTPALIADIFLGKITTWNDPAIAAANSGVTLPSTKITVFFRSDESGTTENFAKYLAAAAPEKWTAEPSKKWAGTVGEGKEKSAGVADSVKGTAGGITYVEWSYARDNQLGIAKVDNGGGAIELTGATAGKALAVAEATGEGNDLRLKLDYTTKDPDTYPIVLVTYEIVCSKGLPADKTALVKSFLTHFVDTETQSSLEEIGYAPLPEEIRAKVATAVQAIS
ncbi:MAG: phosphate ABC transporter substrate-binding protein PstS [Actinomycetota bacterium]